MRNKKDKIRGTTLIEALTFLFIFSLVTMAFYSAWTVATNYIFLAKNQLVASALANEKLEIIRNLAFEDVVHTGMDSNAILLQNEDLNRSGRVFHIFTQIKGQNDPFDGECQFTGDTDCLAPIDYKDVKITVSWDSGSHSITSSSRFVPAGIEQPDPTKGILVVNVLSDKESMSPVSGANILLERIDIAYSDNQSTDGAGRSVISGLPESIKKYKVTLTKSGYETVATELSFADGGIYNPPAFEHASVVALSVNTLNMYQNRTADLTIKTENYIGNDAPDMNYHIEGGKELGKAPDGVTPVYSLIADDQTGSDGEKFYDNASPGNHGFVLAETGYKIIGSSRSLPFDLIPGETATVTIKVSPENTTGILFLAKDNDSGLEIPGASVHLTSAGGYDETVVSDGNGRAFFPAQETAPLTAGDTYDYTVDAGGFGQETGQVGAEANVLKDQVVSLTAS